MHGPVKATRELKPRDLVKSPRTELWDFVEDVRPIEGRENYLLVVYRKPELTPDVAHKLSLWAVAE